MNDSATQLLTKLIALPSVNPMGRKAAEAEPYEAQVTEFLVEHFRSMGVPCQTQPVEPRRENVIAWLEGLPSPAEGGKTILWEVHQDTVPVDGMTIDPFCGETRGGRIYGRGACDVKGSMAAMLAAIGRLVQDHGRQPRATLVMAATVNEEHGFTGASELVRSWDGNHPRLPGRPDVALVAEPTGLNVVVAHKGVVRWKCRTRGRAAHSSQPELGDNAIYTMARVVQAIEQYQATVLQNRSPHPRCGRPTICVSTMTGGICINTVPDEAVIEIDRRLVPEESPDEARGELIDFLNARDLGPQQGIVHEPPGIVTRGLSDRNNGPLAAALVRVAGPVFPQCRAVGVPYGTDASVISATGLPTVVFGPGSIDQAHTADEWIEVEQLDLATEIFYRMPFELRL
jgi:acetylornithine deacetylase